VMPPPKEFTVCAVTSRRYDGLASGPRQRDLSATMMGALTKEG